MVRTVTVLVLLGLLSLPAHAQKRVALVIGNSAYQHTPRLENPKNDAADMAAVLKQLGFQVIDGFHLDKTAFERKVRDFSVAWRTAEVGLFFYAGHGLQVGGQNYLVPVDAKAETADALDWEMVRLDLVQRTMERAVSTNIIFLDACRNNPLARNLARAMGTRSADIGGGLAAVESGVGTLISFSTQPGNVAQDGAGRNSPFTGALVKRIAESNDDLSALLIDVRNDVRKETQNRQVPWEHSALTGRFYFNPAARPASSAAPATQSAQPQPSDAAQAWPLAERSTDPAVLEAFINYYGDTFYGAMARSRLAELKRQQVAVAEPPKAPPSLPSANSSAGTAPSPQADENEMRTRYAALVGQGGTSIFKRDYDGAIAEYSEAIRLIPANALAFFGRGLAYGRKGDHDRAIADYSEAIRLDPKYAIAFHNRGMAYANKSEYDRAIADYSETIRLDPKHAQAFINRGLAYANKGDHDRAIADYGEAIRLNSNYATAFNNRGIAYANKRGYDRAIADYSEAIRLDPKHTTAFYNRGLAYSNKGDQDRAIADYSEAIRLDPKHANAFFNRGLAYGRKSEYDRAIADYSEVIQFDPKNAGALINRGNAYRDKGDHDRAIADYSTALRLDSNSIHPDGVKLAFFNRGTAYASKREYQRAIADYSEAIRLDPKYVNAFSNRGRAYANKGDQDRAIADYSEAIRLDPKYVNAFSNRGRAYANKGDQDRAIADYSEAIRLDPKSVDAFFYRGLSYGSKREYDR